MNSEILEWKQRLQLEGTKNDRQRTKNARREKVECCYQMEEEEARLVCIKHKNCGIWLMDLARKKSLLATLRARGQLEE